MFKVLLADDEKIILQGVSTLVRWEDYGAQLIGTALDGQSALDMIKQHTPDIVITDIKMPGMNGLELIREARAFDSDIRFITLSGYEEFEFAKKAMEYGVKHYLLKPCSERVIAEVLGNVIEEIKEVRQKEAYIQTTRYNLEKVMPKVKEQFLKDFLTNKTYGPKEWAYYSQLLQLEVSKEEVRLIAFELEGSHEFEYIFALQNIAAELTGEQNKLLLSAAIGERVVLLIENQSMTTLFASLKQIKRVYKNYYNLAVTIAISDSGNISELRKLYKQTLECLTHRFYLGEGSMITHQDIRDAGESRIDFQFDHEELAIAMRSGNRQSVETYLSHFFEQLKRSASDIDLVKSYTLELFMIIVREAGSEVRKGYLQKAPVLQSMATLAHIEEFIMQSALEVAGAAYDAQARKQSRLVRKMKELAELNIGEESFSLNKMASETIFMSADYLGKLFRKETGERFTNYLVRLRVEKAKELIQQADENTIGEIAEKVGFANNPKYFSQVFKKATGYSPSEYKKFNGLAK